MIRVILDERNAEKQQHGDNFTWISQKCEVMNSKKELKEKAKLPGESGGRRKKKEETEKLHFAN